MWKGAVILRRSRKYRQYRGRVFKKKKKKGRGGRRNEISLVPSPGGHSAKTSVTIRLFVLLTASLLLGRAVPNHSSFTWSRQVHEALRGGIWLLLPRLSLPWVQTGQVISFSSAFGPVSSLSRKLIQKWKVVCH